MDEKRIIPSGEWDYRELAGRCYYVDKTLLIRDLWKNGKKVSLFTRPRRFGKSLNMDTVKTFFEKTEEDNSVYFEDKKIWRETGLRVEQGKYPVICMSFAGANKDTWDETFYQIKVILSKECKRHPELRTSDRVDDDDLEIFDNIRTRKAEDGDYDGALDTLMRMLRAHHGVAPIVLIDEYDVPIQTGYEKGYYNKAVGFMKNFFMNGLKTGADFTFAYLTGVTRVSEESIFSGINNFGVYTVLDEDFSEYFGFTREEVQEILDYYGYGEKMDELVEWYDGYDFGGREIFNPWSVMNYVKNRCRAEPYWTNTSSNSVIGGLLRGAASETAEKLARLLQGEEISCAIEKNTVFPDLKGDADSVFTLLLFSGYLKSVGKDEENSGDDGERYFLKIPNKEIRRVFSREILRRLQPKGRDILGEIWDALERRDEKLLESCLTDFLSECESYYDDASESVYHDICLGFSAYKYGEYNIRSNRESGDGRYDLSLEPRNGNASLPAVIMEFKRLDKKRARAGALEREARKARSQIDDKRYDYDLRARGFTDVVKVGLAFSGKSARVAF